MKLSNLYASQILDSRGNPTIEVTGVLENGMSATADIPSGAPKGTYEALELRDGDESVYDGMGVLKAISNIPKIFDQIKDIDIENQREIDLAMINLDGTNNKSRLGANAILGVSIVCIKLAALLKKLETYEYINSIFNSYFRKDIKTNLPVPMFNILNGGQHADNGIDFQEFMIIPMSYTTVDEILKGNIVKETTEKQIQMAAEIFHELKKIFKESKRFDGVGDEGGFAPPMPGAKEAINFLCEAVLRKGYTLRDEISFGIDCASNYFYDKKSNIYILQKSQTPVQKTREQMQEYYSYFLENYPLLYLEDFFEEDDFKGFSSMTNSPRLPHILYSGDDLVVTNPKRVKIAVEEKSASALIIKPNQIGTIYETLEVINMCIENDIVHIPSHRSGETNDPFIVDLAVGTGAKLFKAGAPDRGERVAKYNRLLEISRRIENAK